VTTVVAAIIGESTELKAFGRTRYFHRHDVHY